MAKIYHEIRINAPKETVWKALADFGGIHKFSPTVPTSHSTSANNEGLGATRHCDLAPMGSVEERIVEWKAGESLTVEIYDGEKMPPIKNALGMLSVREDSDGTIASMQMEYETKMGVIGAAMNVVMIKGQFDKAVKGILQGLKHHTETGEVVTGTVSKQVLQLATAMS